MDGHRQPEKSPEDVEQLTLILPPSPEEKTLFGKQQRRKRVRRMIKNYKDDAPYTFGMGSLMQTVPFFSSLPVDSCMTDFMSQQSTMNNQINEEVMIQTWERHYNATHGNQTTHTSAGDEDHANNSQQTQQGIHETDTPHIGTYNMHPAPDTSAVWDFEHHLTMPATLQICEAKHCFSMTVTPNVGFRRQDLKVSIQADILVIHGSRDPNVEPCDDAGSESRRHIPINFVRYIPLPHYIDPSHITAEYRNWSLTIFCPKRLSNMPSGVSYHRDLPIKYTDDNDVVMTSIGMH